MFDMPDITDLFPEQVSIFPDLVREGDRLCDFHMYREELMWECLLALTVQEKERTLLGLVPIFEYLDQIPYHVTFLREDLREENYVSVGQILHHQNNKTPEAKKMFKDNNVSEPVYLVLDKQVAHVLKEDGEVQKLSSVRDKILPYKSPTAVEESIVLVTCLRVQRASDMRVLDFYKDRITLSYYDIRLKNHESWIDLIKTMTMGWTDLYKRLQEEYP